MCFYFELKKRSLKNNSLNLNKTFFWVYFTVPTIYQQEILDLIIVTNIRTDSPTSWTHNTDAINVVKVCVRPQVLKRINMRIHTMCTFVFP